jgi:alpha-L-arabinofuranosidase
MYGGTVGDFAGHMRTNVIPVLDAADPGKRIKVILDEWGDWLVGDNWMQTATLVAHTGTDFTIFLPQQKT